MMQSQSQCERQLSSSPTSTTSQSLQSLGSSLCSLSWLSHTKVDSEAYDDVFQCSNSSRYSSSRDDGCSPSPCPMEGCSSMDTRSDKGMKKTGDGATNGRQRYSGKGPVLSSHTSSHKQGHIHGKKHGKKGPLARNNNRKSSPHDPTSRAGTPEDVLSHDWASDTKRKPPFAYATLIFMALSETDNDKMSLSEIYSYVLDNFAYYRKAKCGWKNSIRHNLSQERYFVRVDRGSDDKGKGGYWALNESQEVDYDELLSRRRRKFKRRRSAVHSVSDSRGPTPINNSNSNSNSNSSAPRLSCTSTMKSVPRPTTAIGLPLSQSNKTKKPKEELHPQRSCAPNGNGHAHLQGHYPYQQTAHLAENNNQTVAAMGGFHTPRRSVQFQDHNRCHTQPHNHTQLNYSQQTPTTQTFTYTSSPLSSLATSRMATRSNNNSNYTSPQTSVAVAAPLLLTDMFSDIGIDAKSRSSFSSLSMSMSMSHTTSLSNSTLFSPNFAASRSHLGTLNNLNITTTNTNTATTSQTQNNGDSHSLSSSQDYDVDALDEGKPMPADWIINV